MNSTSNATSAGLDSGNASDGDDFERNDLDRIQYIFILIAITASSFASLCGSATILKLIRSKLDTTHHRTLFAICVVDAIISSSNMVHLYLLPEDKTENPYAFGNTTSCTAVGFILTSFGIILAVQSCFLSVNFLLQIRYKWTDEGVGNSVERFMQVLSVVLSFPLAIFASTQGNFNPDHVSGICIMKEFPDNCHVDEDVECERGGEYGSSLARIAAAMILVFAIVGFGSMIMLYLTVRSTINNSGKFEFAPQVNDKQKQRLRRVSWQCCMYGLAYFNTIIWPILNTVLSSMENFEKQLGSPGPYAIILVGYAAFPLQGLLNFIIFITPRYQTWRRVLPDEPWTYVMRQVLSGKDPPTRNSTMTRFVSQSSRTRNFYSSRHMEYRAPVRCAISKSPEPPAAADDTEQPGTIPEEP